MVFSELEICLVFFPDALKGVAELRVAFCPFSSDKHNLLSREEMYHAELPKSKGQGSKLNTIAC